MEEAEKELTPTRECVETLIRRASESHSGSEAMQLSQAALNTAKAVSELATIFGVKKD